MLPQFLIVHCVQVKHLLQTFVTASLILGLGFLEKVPQRHLQICAHLVQDWLDWNCPKLSLVLIHRQIQLLQRLAVHF